MHLIVVRSADGFLVVGDSHHYAATPDPFASDALADLILQEMDAVLDLGARRVVERWVGTYASATDRWRLTDAPDNATRIVIVTCGAGAPTAFGIAEETTADQFDCTEPDMSRFKAVVFDWAGTMIDFGSFAPMGVFVEAFARFDVAATIEEARAPMGLPKRDHIKAMMAMPSIAAQWRERTGHAPSEDDIDAVYQVFVPMNEEVVANYATLVPGARDAVDALRARGLKIGSTTGYTRSIMERVLPLAAQQGFTPDTLVCADDVIEGRPGPLAMYQCFVDLGVYPPATVIKVDDTEPGIGEGVAAGSLTVGVALSGNYVGMTPEQLAAAPAGRVAELRAAAAAKLTAAGADHVIDTVADLPALVARLEG